MPSRKLLALVVLLSCAPGGAAAAGFNGALCYRVHFTQRDLGYVDETFYQKIQVTRPTTKTCFIQSLAQPADDYPAVYTGMCIFGDQIYLNMVGTQRHLNEPWADTEIMQVTLDKTSLNGDFYQVSHDYNTATGQLDDAYSVGTFTKVDDRLCASAQ